MQLKAQQVISACQEFRSVVARVIYLNLMNFERFLWCKTLYGFN